MKTLIEKFKETYAKMLKAYAKGKIKKGRKHEQKLIQLELEKRKAE